MADLVVIVPSRGRPDAASELAATFRETCTADTLLLVVTDADDLAEYPSTLIDRRTMVVQGDPPGSMVSALNNAACWLLGDPWDGDNPFHCTNGKFGQPFAMGFMGDDHRPITVGWDTAYLDALRELGTGIVYGDDLLQSERLPTQAAMTADIVRTVGFMAPPKLRHMYVDNFWLDLGRAADCLRYLPDVIVEHMHPIAGKAEWTEGHQRVNDQAVFTADETSYREFLANDMDDAVSAVRALRGSDLKAEPVAAASTWAEHEWRLFPEGTTPEYTTPEWYADREHAPHLEQEQHRGRLLRTAALVKFAARSRPEASVVDLGAGDGGLLSLLDPGLSAWGYDFQPTNLDAAKVRGTDVRYGDVVTGEIEWGAIAVATEMIEHLIDPDAFVRRIAEHCDVLICSSPWTERPGSAYEFHTWCWDLDCYRALLQRNGFKVLRQDVTGAFQVLLAVKQ
jgi:hypothetical protein